MTFHFCKQFFGESDLCATLYINLSVTDRETEMEEYDEKQDKGRYLIFERLDDSRVRHIDPMITVRQMMNKLDIEHETTSAVSLMVKRDQYHQFRYNQGGNFEKFIEIHEMKAKEFFDAGGTATELERVLQLHQAIPADYNSTLDWFENLSEEKQTYDVYRAKILEKYERKFKTRNSYREWKPRDENREKRKDSTYQQPHSTSEERKHLYKECFICRSKEHIARFCPKMEKEDKKYYESEKNEKEDEKESGNPKPDWMKFKNTKPRAMSATICDESKEYAEKIFQLRDQRKCTNLNAIYEEITAMNVTLLESENENKDDNKMLIDSGAGAHMVNNLELLSNKDKLEQNIRVRCAGNNFVLDGTHVGEMDILVKNRFNETKEIKLQNVIYVPNLSNYLLSILPGTMSSIQFLDVIL